MVSRADAAAFFMKPGKKQANELLKKCRQAIPYGKEHVGQIVHFEDVVPEFCWQGWLAGQAQAEDIFKSKAGDHIRVINCFAEAFPEREPNAGQLPMDQTHLRVDIVCERSDGSAIRLHPSKDKDARIRVGFLDQWRDGIQEQGGHQIPIDKDAVKVARDRALLPPQENTTRPAAVQADPWSNNNATQLAAGAASATSQHGDVIQLADGIVAAGTAAETPVVCGSGDQPPISSSTQQRKESPTPHEPQQHDIGALPYGCDRDLLAPSYSAPQPAAQLFSQLLSYTARNATQSAGVQAATQLAAAAAATQLAHAPVDNSNATQLAAGAASTTSKHGHVTQLADGTVAEGTAADIPVACGSGDQPPMSSSMQQRQETPTPNEPQLQPQHQDGAIPYGWAKYQFEGRYWWHNEGSNTWFWEEQPPPETSQEGSGTLPAGPDTSNDQNSSAPNDNTHDHQHPPRNAAYNAAAPPDLSDDRQLRKKR